MDEGYFLWIVAGDNQPSWRLLLVGQSAFGQGVYFFGTFAPIRNSHPRASWPAMKALGIT
jgi:hypothetical protein